MNERISVPACQRRLATVWFLGGGVVFAILVIQTLTQHYGDQARDAGGWFLPTVMPILTLIVSTSAVTKAESQATVDRSVFYISFGLSLFYLLLVIATIAYQIFTTLKPSDMIDLMKTSNLWLGPVQGLIDYLARDFSRCFLRKARRRQDPRLGSADASTLPFSRQPI